jgi:hypothetical protein
MAAAVFELAAQRRGFPVINRPTNPVIPGVAQPFSPSRAAPPAFGSGNSGQSFRHHQSEANAIVPVPYVFAVPVYVGGSENTPPPPEDPAGSSPQLADPPFAIGDAPPPVRLPAIVNGRFQDAEPAVAAQPVCPQPERDDLVQFFIALKDGMVNTAVAYWVRERTLHYITLQGSHNVVSLELVDRQRSAMLNEGGRIPLMLPP